MTFSSERLFEMKQNQAQSMQKKGKQYFAHFALNIFFPIWKNLHTRLSETLSPVGTNHQNSLKWMEFTPAVDLAQWTETYETLH